MQPSMPDVGPKEKSASLPAPSITAPEGSLWVETGLFDATCPSPRESPDEDMNDQAQEKLDSSQNENLCLGSSSFSMVEVKAFSFAGIPL